MVRCHLNHQIQKHFGVKFFWVAAMVCTSAKKKKAHFINVVTNKFNLYKSFQLFMVVYQMIKATFVTISSIYQRDKFNGLIII